MRRKIGSIVVVSGLAMVSMWSVLAATRDRQPAVTGAQARGVVDVTTIDAYPTNLAGRGWSEALDYVEGRVREWYVDAAVAGMTSDQLVAGIKATSEAIAFRPDDFSDELWWLREMGLRREVLCEALPAEHALRSDYCSPTSFADFDVTAG
jgi:hypothetical protein